MNMISMNKKIINFLYVPGEKSFSNIEAHYQYHF